MINYNTDLIFHHQYLHVEYKVGELTTLNRKATEM